jgi:N-acetylmuramoyl-L-alanine amidase
MRRGVLAASVVVFAFLARAAPAGPPVADYPQAHWLAASISNYSRANRPLSNPINMVVVHATEGSYAGTLQWFRNRRRTT